jgi:phage repressor protein C with HTH and peptisase S24 domain
MKAINRLYQYLEYKEVKPTRYEKEIGLSNGYLGTQLRRSGNLGEEILNNIIDNSLDINPEWLLTGRGEMIKNDDQESAVTLHSKKRKTKDAIVDMQEVPFYDGLEATAGLQQLFDSGKPSEALETIKIPNLPKCDGALTVTGDSMYPLLKSGDIVLYKQTNVQNIFYGEMYLLSVKIDEWEEYITVKYVQKSEMGNDYIKLVSQNQHHQSRDIKIAHIAAIAMVKASIRFNTMH